MKIFTYFIYFLRTGSCYIAHAGLKLMGSSTPPDSASQVAGTADTCHCAQATTVKKREANIQQRKINKVRVSSLQN
jgi:hypothetical protein